MRLPQVMRRWWLLGLSLMILLAGLVLAWNHRYQVIPGTGAIKLTDLLTGEIAHEGIRWVDFGGGDALRVATRRGHKGPTLDLPLPSLPQCDAVHMSFTLQGEDLVPGVGEWQDGRLNLIWADPVGPQLQHVSSTFGKLRSEVDSVVCPAPQRGAGVAIQLDHRGVGGSYRVEDLELLLLRQSAWWPPAQACLVLAGMMWVIGAIRTMFGCRWLPSGLATCLIMVVFAATSIPGPWILKQPLLMDQFPIPVPSVGSDDWMSAHSPLILAERPEGAAKSGQGEVIQDNLVLKIKRVFRPVKSVFHAFFFAGIAFALALLLGVRPAWMISALLAVASEGAQLAFGFGVGWDELADLSMNALGILAGCLLHSRVNHWLGTKWKPWRQLQATLHA